MRRNKALLFLFFLLLLTVGTAAQDEKDNKVNVALSVNQTAGSSCVDFSPGSPDNLEQPAYPIEAKAARVSGSVRVEVTVNESGQVINVIEATGPALLQQTAKQAALRTRFSSSKCDKRPVSVTGVIVYNFVLRELNDIYVAPKTAAEFRDVKNDSPYYEAILTLTENYGISFGYADGGFHPNAPISKGDFAHFMRLTLDLLQDRARVSRKIPRDIDLYNAFNPNGLKNAELISDLERRKPYAQSVGFLVNKYDIALVNEKNQFNGRAPLKLSEVVGYWNSIFGDEAIPVNFNTLKGDDRIMTRGEFALFLHESMYVLTYKVLP